MFEIDHILLAFGLVYTPVLVAFFVAVRKAKLTFHSSDSCLISFSQKLPFKPVFSSAQQEFSQHCSMHW